MVASIDQLLSVTYTTKVVSRVAAASNTIARRFGMAGGPPGSGARGANVSTLGHRQFGYDIFSDTRQIGRSTVPGAPAAVSKRQAVGRVNGTFPRMHDSLPLLAEVLHNRRAIGGSSSAFDERGRSYISRQQRFLGQKAGNFRSLLIGGMLRGKLYAHQQGDGVYYDYTSTLANWTMDWQIPTGNLTQLNMLGAGNIINVAWSNPQANIPEDLLQINAAFQQLVGSRLELMIINSVQWNQILNNDYVIQNAGSSSTAFDFIRRGSETMENGMPNTTFEVQLKVVPWLRILVTDEGLDVGDPNSGTPTYTKFIPDGYAWFGPEPSPTYMEMLEGDEPIAEGENMPWVVKAGLNAWSHNTWNPTGTQLMVLDNAIPALYVPASTAFGQVDGF